LAGDEMKRTKWYLLLIAFMFGFIFSFGNPSIPLYTKQLGITEGMVGFYFASGGVGLFFFATLWGALGDIKDRNKVLGLVFVGVGVGQVLFGSSDNEYVLLVASLIIGVFTAGVLVNIYSYINDSFVDEQRRNKMLSYVVSLCLLGAAVAYIVGGDVAVIISPNYNYVFLIQGLLSVGFGLFIFLGKTTLIDVDHHLSRRHFWINIKQVFRLPWVPIYTITLTFFISFSHNNVKRFLDYYIINKGFSAFELGLLVFVVGIVGLLANLFIAPFFLKRFHNFRFLQIQFLITPIALFLTFYVSNIMFGMYTFYLVYTIMLAVYEPTAISFMSDNKDVSQGVLVGVRQSIVGLGTTIGFITGGFLFEKNNLYVFHLAVVFYIIVFVGFSILIYIKNKDVKEYRKSYLKEDKDDRNRSW